MTWVSNRPSSTQTTNTGWVEGFVLKGESFFLKCLFGLQVQNTVLVPIQWEGIDSAPPSSSRRTTLACIFWPRWPTVVYPTSCAAASDCVWNQNFFRGKLGKKFDFPHPRKNTCSWLAVGHCIFYVALTTPVQFISQDITRWMKGEVKIKLSAHYEQDWMFWNGFFSVKHI